MHVEGTMHFAGLSLNPLTYIILVMAIGLLVDFIMHVLLRYYECDKPTREEKVLETLRTMGGSILLGGLSTILGVLPLAFATSQIIGTVFVMFVALVMLGVTHGLILLPVLLSYVGPEVCVTTSHRSKRGRSDSRSVTAASLVTQKETVASPPPSPSASLPVSPVASSPPASPGTPVVPTDVSTHFDFEEEVECSATFKAKLVPNDDAPEEDDAPEDNPPDDDTPEDDDAFSV
jgi:Patched family